MRANFTRYADIDSIVKNDDGTIIVSGFASSGAVDSDGEVITSDAMKAAIPDYMKFGAVREMHGKSAAGTALEAEVQADGRTAFSALVVDPIAIKKVEAGVYKGFSIGGKVLDRSDNTITALKLIEVSLVDRPANPEALITMYKSEEIEDKPADEVVAETVEAETVAEEVAEAVAEVTEETTEEKSESVEVEKSSGAEGESETITTSDLLSTGVIIEKAGSKYSAATKAALADIHKHAMGLCEKLVALGYEDSDETKDDADTEMAASTEMNKFESLEKSISDLKSDLEKAMGETKGAKELLAKADARIKQLEAQPAEGKAVLKSVAVSKAEDTEKAQEVSIPKEGTPEYGTYLMKSALSQPINK